MIKCETLGMLDVAKNNPVLKSEKDMPNYSFIVDDGDTYVIMNEINGDAAYRKDEVIKAGDFLNGFMVKAWEGQKLIIDAKHIDGEFASVSASQKYSSGTIKPNNIVSTSLILSRSTHTLLL